MIRTLNDLLQLEETEKHLSKNIHYIAMLSFYMFALKIVQLVCVSMAAT